MTNKKLTPKTVNEAMVVKDDKSDTLRIDKSCPFQQALGDDEIRCGSWCPHFKLDIAGDSLVARLSCGQGTVVRLKKE